MKGIGNYIIEKLHLNKDFETSNSIDEINKEFVSKIKEHILDKYHGLIKFEDYDEYIEVGKSKKYIFLKTKTQHKWIYKPVSSWIEENLNIAKPCKSNNMILYIYPKYD